MCAAVELAHCFYSNRELRNRFEEANKNACVFVSMTMSLVLWPGRSLVATAFDVTSISIAYELSLSSMSSNFYAHVAYSCSREPVNRKREREREEDRERGVHSTQPKSYSEAHCV